MIMCAYYRFKTTKKSARLKIVTHAGEKRRENIHENKKARQNLPSNFFAKCGWLF